MQGGMEAATEKAKQLFSLNYPYLNTTVNLEDQINPLVTTTLQASSMLVISQFFHLVLKPLGHPGPVAQILAGIVLSPSLLSRIDKVREFFIQSSSANIYEKYQSIFGIVLMFWIGLEMDIPYLRRNLRKSAIVSFGGVIVCATFGVLISFFIMYMFEIRIEWKQYDIVNLFLVVLANSASPVVIRVALEQKIMTSDVGRLAICSSLISEIFCVSWVSIFWWFSEKDNFGLGVAFSATTGALIVLNYYFAIWCNKRNRNQKYVTNTEVLIILVPIISLAFLIEQYDSYSTIPCFVIGLMFPRKGKTIRTLLRKLSYATYNFILPVYFGYIGFQVNATYLNDGTNLLSVVVMICLSISGKIIGTLAACNYLKIPKNEGILLSLLLNLKGHVELLVVAAMVRIVLDQRIHNLVIIEVVLHTIIIGPAVGYVLKINEEYFSHKLTSLLMDKPDSDFRVLICVYDPRHITSKLGLFSALRGTRMEPMTPYLMHLVELPKKRQKKEDLMYHQLQDGDQYADEDDYGGNDVLEITNAVDAFTMETGLLIHQCKVVSSFARMFDDVCDNIEDMRVSIVFLTFHKHQRVDGKMQSGEEAIRTTNQKLLRHALCSVGIYVVRGQTGFHQPSPRSSQDVAVLFFEGPDDREALACARRIATHPHINLTLIHFQLTSSEQQNQKNRNDLLPMEILNNQMESQVDKEFVEEFYNSYVASGKAGYVQKQVDNGSQTMEALRDMGDMYSLFIVGKGGRGQSPMTTGLSDWEECPELGTVGDLLASSELNITGSVLVISATRTVKTSYLRND